MSENATNEVASSDLNMDRSFAIAMGVILLATLWSYWTVLGQMAHKWDRDPQYSHGYLVPLFSIALLYLRRDRLKFDQIKPSWLGLVLLLFGVVLRLVGAYFYFEWLDHISLIPSLFGLCLLFGGKNALRWAWPAIAFLVFMIPLPHTLEVTMRDPLRRIGTLSSTYIMQTLGLPALAEGNVIVLDDVRIGVVEACSGLRMLVIFFALATAVAILMDRPLWERIVVVLSAFAIALISNIARITVTGILHVTVSHELADQVFHDWAGWLMMPFALLLLWFELWLLSRLFLEETRGPMMAGMSMARSSSSSSNSKTG